MNIQTNPESLLQKKNYGNKHLPFKTLCLLSVVLLTLSFSVIADLTYSRILGLKDVKHLNADISMSAGVFNLSTRESVDGEFVSEYTDPAWKAELELDVIKEALTIKQPGTSMHTQKKDKNEWNIKIPKALPSDLKLNIGAGEANIDLSNSKVEALDLNGGAGSFNLNLANTSLSKLDVKVGTGGLKIDLTGKRDKNLEADISNGVGGVKLSLPHDIGVRVKVTGIFGVEKGEFTKKNGYFVNDLYGKTPVSLEIRVKSGVGGVQLK